MLAVEVICDDDDDDDDDYYYNNDNANKHNHNVHTKHTKMSDKSTVFLFIFRNINHKTNL